jgi:hypothetical protein
LTLTPDGALSTVNPFRFSMAVLLLLLLVLVVLVVLVVVLLAVARVYLSTSGGNPKRRITESGETAHLACKRYCKNVGGSSTGKGEKEDVDALLLGVVESAFLTVALRGEGGV